MSKLKKKKNEQKCTNMECLSFIECLSVTYIPMQNILLTPVLKTQLYSDHKNYTLVHCIH